MTPDTRLPGQYPEIAAVPGNAPVGHVRPVPGLQYIYPARHGRLYRNRLSQWNRIAGAARNTVRATIRQTGYLPGFWQGRFQRFQYLLHMFGFLFHLGQIAQN